MLPAIAGVVPGSRIRHDVPYVGAESPNTANRNVELDFTAWHIKNTDFSIFDSNGFSCAVCLLEYEIAARLA